MILLTPAKRAEMGRRGRKKVESQFDERIVIDRYLKTLQDAIQDA
jgi:glycosyltransferase involved in cell wall biosynthesis